MNPGDLLSVHPLLADRARLAIMAVLTSKVGNSDFNSLLGALDLTKGNLSAHLRKLEEGGLIEITKEFVERKPRTNYRCTSEGKQAVQTYLQTVERVLKKADGKE